MTSPSAGVYIIVTTCDAGEEGKGSVASHTSRKERHKRQPNSCCQLAVCVRTRNV